MNEHEEVVEAPAKVNLCLRILGRRGDGYHLLDSVLAPVSLYDRVRVRIRTPARSSTKSPVVVASDSADLPTGTENVAYQAADLLVTAIRAPVAIEIYIWKHIPIGSGLGGGSSDAAAVLLVLNRLLGRPYGPDELASLASKVGADVPFFIYGRPARVRGVGEHVQPLSLPGPLSLVVCSDGYPLSTRAVYSHHDPSLTRRREGTSINAFVAPRQPFPDSLVNDLEAAALKLRPGLLTLKARLVELGALGALMTGSGSAVFGVWPDFHSAQGAALDLRHQGLWAKAVHTLDVSPAVRG